MKPIKKVKIWFFKRTKQIGKPVIIPSRNEGDVCGTEAQPMSEGKMVELLQIRKALKIFKRILYVLINFKSRWKNLDCSDGFRNVYTC